MRMITERIICFAALVAMLSGCHGIDNPEGDLKGIKLEDWPMTDCSTSTGPVRDIVGSIEVDAIAESVRFAVRNVFIQRQERVGDLFHGVSF